MNKTIANSAHEKLVNIPFQQVEQGQAIVRGGILGRFPQMKQVFRLLPRNLPYHHNLHQNHPPHLIRSLLIPIEVNSYRCF